MEKRNDTIWSMQSVDFKFCPPTQIRFMANFECTFDISLLKLKKVFNPNLHDRGFTSEKVNTGQKISLSLVAAYNQSDSSIGWYHFLAGMTGKARTNKTNVNFNFSIFLGFNGKDTWVDIFGKYASRNSANIINATSSHHKTWLSLLCMYEVMKMVTDLKNFAQRGARTHDRWIKSPTLYRLS